MIGIIFLIICVFSVSFVFVWLWFFKNERDFCEKLYAAGLKRLNAGKYVRAKLLLQKVVLIDSKYKDVEYNLGTAYLKLKEYDSAIGCFTKVLLETPKNFDALFSLAQSFQFKRLYDDAANTYLKAIDENDKSVDCYFNLGYAYYKQAKYDHALEILDKANAMYPNNEQILFYINRCNDELCAYDGAEQGLNIIDEYLKMAKSKNIPEEFNISVARAYAKMGKIKEAEEFCKKSLSSNSESVESYKLLGLIRLIKKDFTETKNLLATALHLQPNNKELHNLLSYALCVQVDDCGLKQCREKYYKLMKKFIK